MIARQGGERLFEMSRALSFLQSSDDSLDLSPFHDNLGRMSNLCILGARLHLVMGTKETKQPGKTAVGPSITLSAISVRNMTFSQNYRMCRGTVASATPRLAGDWLADWKGSGNVVPTVKGDNKYRSPRSFKKDILSVSLFLLVTSCVAQFCR